MAAFVGAPQLQRTQCLKKVWEYIKANGLNEGKDIHLDSVLSKLFDPPLSSPQIMKQLGKHLLEKIEGSALRTATKKRKATGPGNETGKKRASGYMKPVALTTELSALVGEEYMPRSQVVKSVWNYIKANDLQDPRNKKNIICDDRLRSLLGVDRFLGFSLMKYLNKHFLPA